MDDPIANRFPLIEKPLEKRTKAELIEIVMEVAKSHAAVARELEDQMGIEKPVDLFVADVSSAIDRATDFHERTINYNFDVDWQPYADARQGLQKLVDLGHLDDAKSLALKRMRRSTLMSNGFSSRFRARRPSAHCADALMGSPGA